MEARQELVGVLTLALGLSKMTLSSFSTGPPSTAYLMRQHTYRLTFALVPLLGGTIVPLAVFGLTLGQWGTNLIWGPILGFGWFALQTVLGPVHWEVAARLGMLVWPAVILLILFLLSGVAWRSSSQKLKLSLLVALVLSCLPIVPAEVAERIWRPATVPVDFNVLMSGVD